MICYSPGCTNPAKRFCDVCSAGCCTEHSKEWDATSACGETVQCVSCLGGQESHE